MAPPKVEQRGIAQVLPFDTSRVVERAKERVENAVAEHFGPVVQKMSDTAQGFMRQFDRLAEDAYQIYQGPEGEFNPLDRENVIGYSRAAAVGNPRALDVMLQHINNRHVLNALKYESAIGMAVFMRFGESVDQSELMRGPILYAFEAIVQQHSEHADYCDARLVRGAEILLTADMQYDWVKGLASRGEECPKS